MKLLRKIWDRILFGLLYIPMILVEYLSEKIENEIKDLYITEEVIKKKLIIFGIICLSIGLLIVFIIGRIIK